MIIVNNIDVQQGSIDAISVLLASFYQQVAIAFSIKHQFNLNLLIIIEKVSIVLQNFFNNIRILGLQ